MAILSFSDYDPENLSSNDSVEPGKAIFQVQSLVEKSGEYGPYLGVTMTLLAHEKESEVGKEYFQIFPLSGKGAQGTQKLAMAAKVVTLQAFADAKVSGTELNIDFEAMVGEVVAGEIKSSKKGRNKVWDWYSLSDPNVKDYPWIKESQEGEAF